MFHGSYKSDDVTFLLKPINIQETDILSKEKLIQSGSKHYSEMISQEYPPSKEYLEVFYKAYELNKYKFAEHILLLSQIINQKQNPIIVSLARAGTPIGVLVKRTLKDIFKKNVFY